MPTIRDTIDPLNDREVSDEEFVDLDRQHVVLTGTRAKTPEGLRAAAVRQSSEVLADTFAAELADRPVTRPVQDPPGDDGDEDQDDGDQEHDEDPGADPVSTTENTPTPTSTQES